MSRTSGDADPRTPGRRSATTEQLATALAARTDAEIADLLAARPDLAGPVPPSLTAMAARASSRPSVERALALLDATELAVAEAAVALAPVRRPTTAALTRATGLPAQAAHARLHELGLLVKDLPVAALTEALGPHPAGLGPDLGELDALLGPAEAPTTRAALRTAMAGAPESAVRTLEAMTWGPPVGTAATLPEGAAWLVARGVLRALSPTQVVLPREVALAARGGLTHPVPPAAPDLADARRVPPPVVAAEGARAAEEVVRLVVALLQAWQHSPATVLRTGGVGVREVRRTAAALEVGEGDVALLAELAGMAGLLTQDGDEQVAWAPARTAADFLEDTVTERWAALAAAWLDSARTPWLVGTRSEQGTLRAVLEPTLERGWAAGLRTRVLAALASLPAGTAPTAAQVRALLAWERPRATAPEPTVAAVLAEAERIGLTGAGALTAAGRALLDGAPADDVAAALEEALPEAVGELLVQGDLTAVVPGRPVPELADLLGLCASVESRGSALTVRFTAESLRHALDTGYGADELLAGLAGYSRTPLPQPLEYLVRDTARRHGQVRVGAAGAYLRVDDAGAVAGLLGDPALRALRLRTIAPTVLVSPVHPGDVLDVLREAGLAPVLEGSDGAVVLDLGPGGTGAPRRGGRSGRGTRRTAGLPTYPGAAPTTYLRRTPPTELGPVVARMRAGEEQARRDAVRHAGDAPPATDPVHALAVLREAARAGTPVEMVVVGALGKPERRRVQPVSVDGGRVRATDLERDTELTVAVHRISAVAPVAR